MGIYGTGTIEQRGGRFRVRVYVGGKPKGLGTYSDRAEAESVLAGWRALQAAGAVETGGTTLLKYGAKWLDRREIRGHRNSATDRSRWETHVARARFADWPLPNIGRRDVRQWVEELEVTRAADKRGKRSLSSSTVRHCLNLLRTCLQSAVDDELLERNVASGLRVAKRVDPDAWTYLLPDEQSALLTCPAIPRPERLIIAVALGTGLRQGELWNLELSDVHAGEDEPAPFVFVRWGKKGKPPKNGKTRRVPLFGIALVAMREWLAGLPAYTRSRRYPGGDNPHRLAFPTARGCRRGYGKPPRGWRAFLVAAGLVPERRHDRRSVRWHDLRHSCATSLLCGWWGGEPWTLDRVRDVLGHSSVTVTERYAHVAPGELAARAAATPGTLPASNRPKTVPELLGSNSQTRESKGRVRQDSNLRPTAPENESKRRYAAVLGPLRDGLGTILRPLAERYVQAVASRNRFSHRYGLELAEAVLAAIPATTSRRGVVTLTRRRPRPPPRVRRASATRPTPARRRGAACYTVLRCNVTRNSVTLATLAEHGEALFHGGAQGVRAGQRQAGDGGGELLRQRVQLGHVGGAEPHGDVLARPVLRRRRRLGLASRPLLRRHARRLHVHSYDTMCASV